MTMTLVSTVTVGSSGTSDILFSGIPQTGTDLYFLISGRTDGTGNTNLGLSFNASNADVSWRKLTGNGSTATSTSGTTYTNVSVVNDSAATSNTFCNGSIYVSNYSSTSTSKPFSIDLVTENNATAATQQLVAGLWNSTSALTSIEIKNSYWLIGTTISLYTITKGSGGATVS